MAEVTPPDPTDQVGAATLDPDAVDDEAVP